MEKKQHDLDLDKFLEVGMAMSTRLVRAKAADVLKEMDSYDENIKNNPNYYVNK